MAEIALATEFAIILVTATTVGLIAKQTGQPTIIAYILTGLLLGPAMLGIVTPSELTEAMAELGLAFLLFLLGIKMRFSEISHVLRPIVAVSLPQMTLVCLTGLAIALAVGFPFWEAVLIGLAVMYSSTAVVIKLLTDKDEVTSLAGTLDVGVLLVQDIVVVILLALLAAGRPDSAAEVVVTLLVILGLIAIIGGLAVAASRYLLPVVFRRIAADKDAFFLVAIAWAFLFVFVTDRLDLSIELGAFIAGLAIAQLPYSTELQDRITPLTNLFILIFFASIGLQLSPVDLLAHWEAALIASVLLMAAKFVIFFLLFDWQGFSLETSFLGSVNMMQISEFALVVGAVGVAGGFIGEPVLGFLTLVALCTMSLSVYLITYNSQLYRRVGPALSRWNRGDDHEADGERHQNHALIVGYDTVTRAALPVLRSYYDDIVVVDRTVDHVETLREAGHTVIYGDIRHLEVQKKSGLAAADFVLSSTTAVDATKSLLGAVHTETTVFVEAEWVADAVELYDLGADYVVMSPQLTADRLGELLDLYLTDPATFERAVDRDVARLTHAESDSHTADNGGDSQ